MPDFGRWTSNGGDPSLNEINRSDRFLDALASQQQPYVTDHAEAELAQLMAGWRDEIRHAPLTAVVTPRDAVIALDRAASSRRRTRLSLAVIGSAAAAVLSLGGVGAVVAGSGPGDPLYGLRTMLFGEQHNTRDDAVVLAAQSQMAEVQQLIDQGQWEAAQDKLQTLTTTVATVSDEERKEELVTQWQELTVKVEAQDPAATLPPDAPAPVFPDITVLELPPVVENPATTSDTSTETTAPSDDSTTTEPSPTEPSPTETESPSSEPTLLPSTTQPTQSTTQPTTTQPTTTRPTPTSVPRTTSTTVSQTTTEPAATAPATTAPATTVPTTTVPATTTAQPTPQPTPTAQPTPTEAPTSSVAQPTREAPEPEIVTTTVVIPEPEEDADQPR
ncbi:anti-sigma-D factor RsdA [Mycolicibacterium phlei]